MVSVRLLLVGTGFLMALVGLSMFGFSGVATAGPADSATVLFGDPKAGSPFPPPADHDRSAHAADKLVPRTAVISQGGIVTFETFGVHQVAVYEDGTKARDIDDTMLTGAGAGCPPVPLISDTNNRLKVLSSQPCAGGSMTPSYTFNDPGRYLVICTFLPHFAEADMYGWVIVK